MAIDKMITGKRGNKGYLLMQKALPAFHHIADYK